MRAWRGSVHGGHAWGRVLWELHGRGGCAWQGACVARDTATAADGTHPTGMHSCFIQFFYHSYNSFFKVQVLVQVFKNEKVIVL